MIKNNILVLGLLITVVALTVVGVAYAFFSADITGSETVSTISIGSGTVTIEFAGGANITASNIYPQLTEWGTKTVTLTSTNTTTQTMSYMMKLDVMSNTFTADAIKYTLTSTNQDNNGTIIASVGTQTGIPTGANTITLGTGNFVNGNSKVHSYVFKFFFPDSGGIQNEDQGKAFTARVTVEAAT